MKAICSAVFLAISFSIAWAQTPSSGWVTEDDFRKDEAAVMEKIVWLENNPLSTTTNDTKATTQFVLSWLSGVPYVTVKYDEVFLANLTNSKKYKFGEKFRITYLFGKAYYLLENPESEDEVKASARGIEGMVTVYNFLKKVDPSVKHKLLEKYSRLVRNAKLESYVRSILEKEAASDQQPGYGGI